MGGDVGENNAAALSTGRIFKAGKMKDDRDKYLSSRARFQRNGSRSARQALRKASGREKRHVEQINDEISKSIIEDAAERNIRLIVLEDLTNIRERIKAGLKVRARLHRWPFRELQQKIVDKACRAGIEVIFVDPRYTSQTFPTRAGDHARTLKRVPFVELSGYDLKIGEGTASAFAINSGRMAVKTILGNK